MVDEANQQTIDPPRAPSVRWTDLLIVVVGGLGAGIVLTVAFGMAALLVAIHFGYRPVSAARFVKDLQSNFSVSIVALVLTDFPILAAMWLVTRRVGVDPLARYFPPVRALWLGLAGAIGTAFSLALNGGNMLLERLGVVKFQVSASERALVPHTPLQFAASLAVICLFAPFAEELLFRGMLFTWLREGAGLGVAVAVSALVFAGVHGKFAQYPGAEGWVYSAELLVVGVALALLVARTRSLRTSFAAHMSFNVVAMMLSVLGT